MTNRGVAGKQIDHHAFVSRIEMLDKDKGHATVRGKRSDELPTGVKTARRSADPYDRECAIKGLRLAELCQKYGIAELSVFGSVARGDARADSDVDLLYVRVPGNDLGMSYFALQDDLEKLFGRPVDLVPKEGLHRVIRDQVLADAQVLYAA